MAFIDFTEPLGFPTRIIKTPDLSYSVINFKNGEGINITCQKHDKPSETYLVKSDFGTYNARVGNYMYYIMPRIVNVDVIQNKVVKVEFADGTIEKAVLNEQDEFSFDAGIAICIAKKMIGDRMLSHREGGSSIFNKIVKDGVKVYWDKCAEEDRREDEEYAKKQRYAKIAAKKAAKKAKREAAAREKQIEIQAEAYYRAMKKLKDKDEPDT